MILHVVVFTWQEHVTEAQVAEITAALRALPPQIPELQRYDAGPDLGLNPNTGDYGVVALVADEAGLRAYLDHPAHQATVRDLIAPNVAQRSAVQIAA
jgi:Stress responsive A/B Barrel Domain